MQRHYALKSEIDRLADLSRCFGKTFAPRLLDDRDRLCAEYPALAPFLSDVVIAAAMDRFDLGSDTLVSASEELLLQIVGWAHVALPQQTTLALAEFLEPALLAMARTPVGPSMVEGMQHSMLMLALQQLNPGESGPRGADDLLRWYYLEAVPRERLHRCVSRAEIEALNAGRQIGRVRVLSILDIWALQQDAEVFAKVDPANPTSLIQARETAWAIREADPAFDFYYLPFRPRAAEVQRPRLTIAGAGLNPMIADTYRIPLGSAQYFGTGWSGNTLLLAEEWDIEEGFAWALAPVATLVFALDAKEKAMPRSLGLTIAPYAAAETMGQTLMVFLNGVRILSVAVSDVLGQDAVASHDLPFMPGLNVVQFGVDEPLIPSVQFGSHDTRALGVAMRRLWVA